MTQPSYFATPTGCYSPEGVMGFVVYLPDDSALDETEHILLAAGLKPLPGILDLALEA